MKELHLQINCTNQNTAAWLREEFEPPHPDLKTISTLADLAKTFHLWPLRNLLFHSGLPVPSVVVPMRQTLIQFVLAEVIDRRQQSPNPV